jgi:hypothetical protein
MSEPYAQALFTPDQTEAIKLHLSVTGAVKNSERYRRQFNDETGKLEGTWRWESYIIGPLDPFSLRQLRVNLQWWTPTGGSPGLDLVELQKDRKGLSNLRGAVSLESSEIVYMPYQYETLMSALHEAPRMQGTPKGPSNPWRGLFEKAPVTTVVRFSHESSGYVCMP